MMRTRLWADSRPNPFGAMRPSGADLTARREFSGSASRLAVLPEERSDSSQWRDPDAGLVPCRRLCPGRQPRAPFLWWGSPKLDGQERLG